MVHHTQRQIGGVQLGSSLLTQVTVLYLLLPTCRKQSLSLQKT